MTTLKKKKNQITDINTVSCFGAFMNVLFKCTELKYVPGCVTGRLSRRATGRGESRLCPHS